MDIVDTNSIASLLQGVLKATADLTRANSAPELFLLMPYPDLRDRVKPFSSQNYEYLGKVFTALIRVDERRAIYQSYKSRDQNIWAKYFRSYNIKLDDIRKVLVGLYIDCRTGKDCSATIPQQIDGLILSDLLSDGALRADCPRSYTSDYRPNPSTSDALNYISSINIYWTGKARFTDDIDLSSIRAGRVTPDLKIETVNLKSKDYLRIWDSKPDWKNLYSWIYSRQIEPSSATLPGGSLNYDFIVAQRDDIAKSVFSLKFRLYNGIEIEQILGMPAMNGCNIGG